MLTSFKPGVDFHEHNLTSVTEIAQLNMMYMTK